MLLKNFGEIIGENAALFAERLLKDNMRRESV